MAHFSIQVWTPHRKSWNLIPLTFIVALSFAWRPSLVRAEADDLAAPTVAKSPSAALRDDVLRRWRDVTTAIKLAESELSALEKQFGEDHPDVAQAREALKVATNREVQARAEYFAIKKQIEESLQGLERDAQALLSDEINTDAAPKFLGASTGDARSQQAAAVMQLELAKVMEQLTQRERQVAQLSEQLARLERSQASLPIDGTETKVFSLRHVKAPDASGTLESLFGSHVRVATDDRSNSLIVIGKTDTLKVVEAILLRLDQSEEAAESDRVSGAQTASAPKSLLLRVFWLADGLPKGEGQDPNEFLPSAVIKAMDRLGLDEPRLVTQTVNSLAAGDQAEVEFSTQVPAMLLRQPAGLQCVGRMRPMNGDRTALNMEINVSGPSIACQLKGSLATPLGHYMVLGTANSVIADPASMAGGGMMGGGEMGMEGGRFAGRRVYAGEGVAGFAIDPATGVEGAMGGEGMAAPAEPKYNTSRFAFVVQVIEGESYAAEE